MSIDNRIDRYVVVYFYNGILYNNENMWIIILCYYMDKFYKFMMSDIIKV